MALELELTFGGKRFRDAKKGLQALGDDLARNVKDFNPAIRKELRDLMDTVIDALRKRHDTAWRAGQRLPTGDRQGRLAKRSGGLLRSLRGIVSVSGKEASGQIRGDGLLLVHENGKTIRPKRAQFLTIPLPAAMDSRGVPKKRRARDWPNTFVKRSKRGNLIIFQKKGGQLVPLYFLTKETKIPKRLGLKVTVDTAIPVFQDRLFDRLTRELLKGI